MDPVHFTGKELLEMAVRIEENGMRYYTDAMKAAKNDSARSLFKLLADEEGQHIKAFTELKKALHDDSPSEGFDPYIGEASLYLKALADTEVFTEADRGARLPSRLHGEKEILGVAIGMEKDSILFYYELHRMVRDRDKPILEKLIVQEKEHLKKLTDLLGAL